MVGRFKIPLIVRETVRSRLMRPPSQEMEAAVRHLLSLHPRGIVGMLFYGSCLRSSCSPDSIADIYVIVDSYTNFHTSYLHAAANFLLPPNVYFTEAPLNGSILRMKYAVVSLNQLQRASSCLWFHSYFWARLSQPMQLIYSRDAETAERITLCLCRSLYTFASRVLPCMDSRFSVEDFWNKGLAMTYMAELRPEGSERAEAIWKANRDYFEALTPHIFDSIFASNAEIRKTGPEGCYEIGLRCSRAFACTIPWAARMAAGKILSVMRLTKAVFTFTGGVDYALWKIERHTGTKMELGPFLRRHPLLAMILTSWRLLRKRAIR